MPVGSIAPHSITRSFFVPALFLTILLTAQPLFAAPGDLDCSFGNGGTIIHDLGSIEAALDARRQSDGKIVTLGSAPGALRLTRFLEDGTLDSTFGESGTMVHLFAGLGGASSLAVDSMDRIVVGGAITVPDGADSDQEAFVVRFTANGMIDPAFGGGAGWTSFDYTTATASGGTEAAAVVVVDDADRPVVGGSPDANGPVLNPSDANLAVARLDTAGALDPTFDGDGIALASSAGVTDDILRSLAIDAQGRIVAVGTTGNLPAPRDTILARWTAAGVLDSSFDADGLQILDLSENGSDDRGVDVGFDSTGAILALGASPTPAVARLTDTGALDPGFAGDGIVQQSFLGSQDVTERLRVQSDDKILISGWPVVAGRFHFAVMRLTAAGTLDTTWASPDGVATTIIGFTSRANAAILQPDQKILLLGSVDNNTDLAMARYLNDGQPNGPPTTIEILSDTPDPSLVIETVTVTYSVTSAAGSPSGTVEVRDGDITGCTGTVADGSCSLAWPIVQGVRTLTARFVGGGGFCPSTDTETHTVLVPTATSFEFFLPIASVVGEPVTVGVAVDPLNVGGVGPVTGTVTIDDGAGASCLGVLAGGAASCQLTPTVAGTRQWTATFPGSSGFAASTQTASRTISPAATVTSIVADDPDPSLLLDPFEVQVAVAVAAPGAGTATGDVHVEDGAGASCVAALSSGVGSCLLTPTMVGQRDLTAVYPGDGNFAVSQTTEPHLVTDGVAPQVVATAALPGTPFDACDTLRSVVSGLQVTYSEPVAGADQIGSYRVLAAGPDADLSTASCDPVAGDDLESTVTSANSDADPSTPTVTLQLAQPLPTGLARVIVCETVEDLGTLALDGDGDGVGGDPFVVTFRIDPANLFANGDFDLCPATQAPWIESVTPPDSVLVSATEDADSSSLSGSVQIVSMSAAPTALAQCVEVDPSTPRLGLSLAARLDAVGGATTTLEAACDFFDLASCAGASTGSDAELAPLPDLAGGWSRLSFSLQPPATTRSALCSVSIAPDQPTEPLFDAFFDRLLLRRDVLFLDGFESGDFGAWSGTVGN
ncbi:MAG: Ig-like domain repeat protein [Acidobacteriota bacterium]